MLSYYLCISFPFDFEAGYGLWLYQWLIILYPLILQTVNQNKTSFSVHLYVIHITPTTEVGDDKTPENDRMDISV